MTVRAVLFDIGGIRERVDDLGWLASFAQRVNMEPDEFSDVLERRVDPDHLMDIGGMSESEYRQRVGDVFAWPAAGLDAFMAAMLNWYCGELDASDDGLRQNPASPVANGHLEQLGRRRTPGGGAPYRFSEYFDPIVYSHEIGLAKPDPRAYAAACDQMGVSAADVLFIDDLEVNVDGARRIGMTTILHASADATIAAASQVLGLHVSAISWPSLRAWRHSLQVRPPADRQAELDER